MQKRFVTSITILIVALLSLAGMSAFAATSQIQGKVADSRTGDPLPGATVLLEGTSLGAATDLNGRYSIENVPVGTYTIRATYVGYNPAKEQIVVRQDENLTRDFKLVAVAIQAKNVVVTAQAAGQNAAINQQLTSDKVVNVVSAAKIQELPDANAAESVGRLPGISLIREGGEAAYVVIRGLAPQYNEVLIDGVEMPSTTSDTRSTNLSMISSSMLGGITVTKEITPDMDAAVIGGVVNFDLREAQNTNGIPKVNLMAQGGYDNLQSALGPYKFVASVENRFLDNRFGIFAEASAERVNLTSDGFGGSYYNPAPKLNYPNPVYLAGFNLDYGVSNRQRYGATVTMDYRIPNGKIDFMNFVSQSDTKGNDYGETYYLDASPDYHSYSTTDSRNYLSVITSLLDFKKDFSFIGVDAKVSHSYSESHDPNDLNVGFIQDNVGIVGYRSANPTTIPGLAKTNPAGADLAGIANYASFTSGRNLTGSVDFLSHINFSTIVTSELKFGGMFRYTNRVHNYTQSDGVLNQGSGQNLKAAIRAAYPWMATGPDSASVKSGFFPINLFAVPNFSYGNFLNGQYTMGPATSISMLRNVLSICQKNGTLDSYSYDKFESLAYSYSGHEDESGAYAMYTLNVGPTFTFLPGVRYQNLYTSYTAPRGIESNTARTTFAPQDTTTDESHGYWLPMAHLIYRPVPWVQIHLAYTNTLTYPDYRAIIPWIVFNNTAAPAAVTWNNYALKPGQSANYDVVLSLYDNTLGLFSVDGFLKHITNLIFPVTRYIINPANYEDVPSSYKGDPIYTYINNPYPVDNWGVELDWQTHFWYLPGPLSGLVLSANYTHIFSGAKYLLAAEKVQYFPKYSAVEVDTFYTDRLLDQPNDVANLALGYDYKGFSIRVSMIYQSNTFTGEEFWPELRSNTGKYVRWDLAVKQNLPWSGLQVYGDIENLNGENDISYIQGSGFPTSESDYGMTADLGIRLAL